MKKVLVTGCLGQIGSELITRLRQELGSENVIATDIRMPEVIGKNDIFEILDVMDYEKMRSIAEQYQVDTLIHLAALLSAVAEAKPQLAWDLNMTGLVNALEVARRIPAEIFYAKFNRRVWSKYSKRSYPTRYSSAPYNHVWGNEGSWRTTM